MAFHSFFTQRLEELMKETKIDDNTKNLFVFKGFRAYFYIVHSWVEYFNTMNVLIHVTKELCF